MAQPKKFGAFSGVFTPSILTILGVIMYMRMGWVVGQAGLIVTVVIILVSHIISITTGLSISSIATDKKIKTGGIYYMLSRSLGLPMGGAIGLALFVGTALSISLYIVGFSESFLAWEKVRNILGHDPDINDIRICGTIVITLLVIIAFISTSFVMKMQFFILIAIVLSLISIGIGFGVNTEYIPIAPVLSANSAEGAAPISLIFAIFFPAVTGFTAGVAMSGDLKNPKTTIPKGTMSAIGVGFIIYMILAFAFSYFVNRDLLINEPDFLLKIAIVPVLVLIGIWSATLSSALGGILGGPRIMQAISNDNIGPKFFGKGYGPSNEPRIALILTFVIAEVGILIGELNAIAEVVSMFYLATYGFINLAYFLEHLASTDFRPNFKIHRSFGIVGFIACFGVMLQINMLAMIIALLSMGIIFFLLKRMQLKLEYGDVWQSVWTTVVRKALYNIDSKVLEERNWQPNIVLFSGGTGKRPHLIEFGKFMVGKYGMLSNFDLHENKSAKVLFPKHEQSILDSKERAVGIFTRKQECRDIYEGIETISRIYGFSGVEPNTVLMGWARQTENPVRFVEMLNRLLNLDLNIILLDYDKRYEFGSFKRIDIWWRGAGNNGNLALTLSKFITISNQWRDAKIRLLMVSNNMEDFEQIHSNAEQIFDNLRISAEVKIIDNKIKQASFYDIIRVESIETDLIFIGIPPNIKEGHEKDFVDRTSLLMQDIGTVALIKASSDFKQINFAAGIELTKAKDTEISNLSPDISELTEASLVLPKNVKIADKIENLFSNLKQFNDIYHQEYIVPIIKSYIDLSANIKEIVKITFKRLDVKLFLDDFGDKQIVVSKIHNSFLLLTEKKITELQQNTFEAQKKLLTEGTSMMVNNIGEIAKDAEKYLSETYTLKDLDKNKDDSRALKLFKFKNRLKIKVLGRPVEYKNKYYKIINQYIPVESYATLEKLLMSMGDINLSYINDVKKLIRVVRESLMLIENKICNEELTPEFVKEEKLKAENQINEINDFVTNSIKSLLLLSSNNTLMSVENICEDIRNLNVNKLIKNTRKTRKKSKQLKNAVLEMPQKWCDNQNLFYNATTLEIKLFLLENRLHKIFDYISQQIRIIFDDNIISNFQELEVYFKDYKNNVKDNVNAEFNPANIIVQFNMDDYFVAIKEIIDFTYKNIKKYADKFPESVDLVPNETINDFSKSQYNDIEVIHVAVSKLLDYLLQNELIEPLRKILEKIPSKLIKLNTETKDIVRLTSFSVNTTDKHIKKSEITDNEVLDDTDNNIYDFIDEQQKKVSNQITKTKDIEEQIVLQIQKRISTTTDKFTLYSFVKIAEHLQQYIYESEKQKKFSLISTKYNNFKQSIKHIIGQIWYRQSKAVLLTRNINEEVNYTKVNDLLNFTESVSINKDLLKKLPFYYQQLYLRKQNHYNEFWVSCKKELYEANKAIERHRAGYSGGILIIGENDSGKSFLSQYVCSKYLHNSKLFELKAPEGGSIDTNQFKQAIETTFDQSGGYAKIFSKISENSVLLIDDLELWWEKSENGMKVIDEIIRLIEKFSDKCLFIINSNIHSFEVINKIRKIENYFLNIIECEPFNAEDIKDIILKRHKSSGLKFGIYKSALYRLNISKTKLKLQDDFRSIDYANLFTRYFTFSKGNVGVALKAWIANIEAYDKDTIVIKMPKLPNNFVLEKLDTENLLIIVQFILHKQLTIERLQRITMEEPYLLQSKINFLKRSGVITENKNKILTLNSFIYIHIINKLSENEFI